MVQKDILDMIAEDPVLMAEIGKVSSGGPRALDDILPPTKPISLLPAVASTKNMVLEYILPTAAGTPIRLYLAIYFTVNAGELNLPKVAGERKFFYINHGDLSGIIKECEIEISYRGLMAKPEIMEDGNGRPLGKVYTFEENSQTFVKELVRLVYHFKQKYTY